QPDWLYLWNISSSTFCIERITTHRRFRRYNASQPRTTWVRDAQPLQKDATVPIEITDADVDGIVEVDSKLVKLAQTLHCPIITNDFNLNRVAELQGVKVLNINELANAVKPVLLPGEDIVIKIIQDGKELGQGVGYLD